MIQNQVFEFYLVISDFLAESLKAIKNRQKPLILQYSFPQKTSLILRTSTYSKLKKTCTRNTAKNLTLQISQQKCF